MDSKNKCILFIGNADKSEDGTTNFIGFDLVRNKCWSIGKMKKTRSKIHVFQENTNDFQDQSHNKIMVICDKWAVQIGWDLVYKTTFVKNGTKPLSVKFAQYNIETLFYGGKALCLQHENTLIISNCGNSVYLVEYQIDNSNNELYLSSIKSITVKDSPYHAIFAAPCVAPDEKFDVILLGETWNDSIRVDTRSEDEKKVEKENGKQGLGLYLCLVFSLCLWVLILL